MKTDEPKEEYDDSGSASFRPRARLIRTLGSELITNEIVALQELVKNSYDADASTVTLTFEEPLTRANGAIVIEDDGNGITLEALRSSWMEPATSTKVRNPLSPRGRRVTGEKGIGRFAAARVAAALELQSVSTETGQHLTARFDWGVFDDDSLYLDEIKCRWHVKPAAAGVKPGTSLRMTRLTDDWTRDNGKQFQLLRGELSRLMRPLKGPSNFEIELKLPPAHSLHAGRISPPAFFGKPGYWLVGSVDTEGTIDAVYEAAGHAPEVVLENGKLPQVLFPAPKGKGTELRKPRCGPFGFEFRVWDREREDLDPLATEFNTTYKDIRRDLDQAGGVSIYRDGFRVLLPGNDDWLRLDHRRVQNPTLRLSNNQVVGAVTLRRDDNAGIVDQTNRQGLVDSPGSGSVDTRGFFPDARRTWSSRPFGWSCSSTETSGMGGVSRRGAGSCNQSGARRSSRARR